MAVQTTNEAEQRPRVYIDGQAGTTGLQIFELLAGRRDLELLEIEAARRKDPEARRAMFDAADLAVLCLPDAAAREAVGLCRPELRVIDASTAHRVADDWVYGLPELAPDQRRHIQAARRVANPGCYPTGVTLLLRPLVDAGLLSPEAPIAIHALSGYSGGGKNMIAEWEDPIGGLVNLPFEAPYALDTSHKHIPEIRAHARLAGAPQFVPAVGAFERGMRIQIPLHQRVLAGASPEGLQRALVDRYRGERFIHVRALDARPPGAPASFDPRACNGTNRVELTVAPHPDGHVLLLAVLDNLGKGASGAAVQSLNLMLGLPEDTGLAAGEG